MSKEPFVIEEKPHSALGGSSAKRWISCTMSGALSLEGRGDISSGSIYAAEGTVCHEIAERMIDAGARNVELPEAFQVGEFVIALTPEIEMAAWDFARPCIALRSKARHWGIETVVTLDDVFPVGPPVSLFGSVDFWCYIEKTDTLYICDLKAGKGVPVSAHKNFQLYYYATGALLHLSKKFGIIPKRVKLTIIQPRVGDGQPDVYECPASEIDEWASDELVPAVEKIVEGRAACSYQDGDHCQFCKQRVSCEHLVKKMSSMFEKTKDSLDTIDSERLSAMLDDAIVLEGFIKEIRKEAALRLERHQIVPGWEMKEKQARRKWYDDGVLGGEVARLLEGFLGDEAYAERAILSPAQAEKRMKAHGYTPDFKNVIVRESSGTALRRSS